MWKLQVGSKAYFLVIGEEDHLKDTLLNGDTAME